MLTSCIRAYTVHLPVRSARGAGPFVHRRELGAALKIAKTPWKLHNSLRPDTRFALRSSRGYSGFASAVFVMGFCFWRTYTNLLWGPLFNAVGARKPVPGFGRDCSGIRKPGGEAPLSISGFPKGFPHGTGGGTLHRGSRGEAQDRRGTRQYFALAPLPRHFFRTNVFFFTPPSHCQHAARNSLSQ